MYKVLALVQGGQLDLRHTGGTVVIDGTHDQLGILQQGR